MPFTWKESTVLKPKTVDFLNRYHKSHRIESNKLAYLAGIIDGEGYVKIEKWGTVRLIVGMTDRATPYWLYKNYGGALSYVNKHQRNRKNVWVWRLNGALENLKLMILMYPFLVIKKSKVLECLKLLKKRLVTHQSFSTLHGLQFRGY